MTADPNTESCGDPRCMCCGHTCNLPDGRHSAKGDTFACECGVKWECMGSMIRTVRGVDYPCTHWVERP